MQIFAKTDVGKERQMNQDFYYVSTNDNVNFKLCILADGMGGYKGGEIASSLATTSAKKYIEENFNKVEHNKEELQILVKKAMEYANEVVYQKASTTEELEQMGTTLEICLIHENRAYIGHIGDSRIYRIRKDIMRRITTDHSYVEELVKDGKITREEAYFHPKKNILMKALGCTRQIEPDIMVRGFLENDIICMCSDGLTNMLTEEEIYNIIKSDIKNATSNLVAKANKQGGYDNISVIIIDNN